MVALSRSWGVLVVVAAGVGGMLGVMMLQPGAGCDVRSESLQAAKAADIAPDVVMATAAGGASQDSVASTDVVAGASRESFALRAAVRGASEDSVDAKAQLPCPEELCEFLWSGTEVVGKDSAGMVKPTAKPGEQDCIVAWMKDGPYLAGGKPPAMCVRHYWDLVSSDLRLKGIWGDCTILSNLWEQPCLEDKELCDRKAYIDIGANIGACLLLMLARPDVTLAMGFEPSPANLFYLTSSLLLNPRLSQKVNLYTAALGAKAGRHAMYAEEHNAGNTVLDASTGKFTKVGEVATITLDDVVMNLDPLPYIHLAKVDAQGFEVNILRGGTRVLEAGLVAVYKFELSPTHLTQQKTNSAELLNCFIDYGYYIAHEGLAEGGKYRALTPAELKSRGCKPAGALDLLAVRNRGGAAVQQRIVC